MLCRQKVFTPFDGIDERVPHKINFHIKACVKVFFKRKNAQHTIYIALQLVNSILLPGPDLWGDIVNHFYPFLFGPFGNAHIKTRIIDKDNCIWLVSRNVLLAEFHVAKYGADIQGYFYKAHKGKVAVMLAHQSSYGLHTLSSPKPEISIGILRHQLTHQVGSVQVATGFSGYDVVLHNVLKLKL